MINRPATNATEFNKIAQFRFAYQEQIYEQIPNFDSLGGVIPYFCIDKVEIGTRSAPPCHRWIVSPLPGERTIFGPLTKRNIGVVAFVGSHAGKKGASSFVPHINFAGMIAFRLSLHLQNCCCSRLYYFFDIKPFRLT